MLAINSTTSAKKITPNVLPCAIKHNGPVKTHARYWSPAHDDNDAKGTGTAYFRGRKLRGRRLKVPDEYRGVVLEKTQQAVQKPAAQHPGALLDEDGDEAEEDVLEDVLEVKIAEPKAQFDEMVVWGHEMVPDEEDVYVKGMEEWIGFAEAMHSYEDKPEATAGKT
ncbi:hypothetical protein LTR37_006595 [Vermiconidia calcicola]|uniref:Uncharacterized protein n=1 Tax=Vermiconidia calcicola TaxID=1690605 RepID=A0ACC3NIM5_9PEZI|nr:hypothetical protein LTR37_006595 [Vermiconidia calcicola]